MANDQKPWGCLVRLFWMLAGNAVLVVLAAKMASTGPSFAIDAGYWCTVPLIIAARYVDIRSFAGRDEYGNPATVRDWRCHAAWVVAIAAAVWLLIRLRG